MLPNRTLVLRLAREGHPGVSMTRKALTLIELMLVIALIAFVIALLLPAVRAVRAAVHRAQRAYKLRTRRARRRLDQRRFDAPNRLRLHTAGGP
jgi:prepilin-type N-terminal cleavage/methylation domain-containing protein